jgi:hypothetical protein
MFENQPSINSELEVCAFSVQITENRDIYIYFLWFKSYAVDHIQEIETSELLLPLRKKCPINVTLSRIFETRHESFYLLFRFTMTKMFQKHF